MKSWKILAWSETMENAAAFFSNHHGHSPCSSETNSQLVGPPPTTMNESKRRRSSSPTVGTAAFSKESIILLRIRLAWWSCFRKKTASPSLIDGIPKVYRETTSV